MASRKPANTTKRNEKRAKATKKAQVAELLPVAEPATPEKTEALAGARAAIMRKLGKRAKLATAPGLCDITHVIPTGLEVLDRYILGCGGIPAGRIGEVFSDEGGGKTSLALFLLAAAQQAGGLAILIETEKTLKRERADVFGVNREELILVEPDTIEDVIDNMHQLFDLIPDGVGPNLIVWDSLAATELEARKGTKAAKSASVGKRARLMSDAWPILSRLAREKQAAVVVINQIREKIGVIFGDNTTTPGGHSLKFHASWRLRLWRGAQLKSNGPPTGMYITIKCVKSKVGLPFRKAKFRLHFNKGWDNEWAILNLGKDLKILPKSAKNLQPKVLNAVRDVVGLGGELNLPEGLVLDDEDEGTDFDTVEDELAELLSGAKA